MTNLPMFIEPVFGKKFFGREEILATLNKRVNAIRGGYRQNLALAGPMLAGKSSILRHFLANLKTPDIVPLYIEMSGEDYRAFCVRVMASLLFQFLKGEGAKPEGDFDFLKNACRPLVPDTVRHIERVCSLLDSRKNDDAFEELLGLSSIFKTETGKNCVVILDEFHNLSNFHLKKPFHTLGKFIMIQKNTMYIVSSSQKTLLKDILSQKLSLLFGNFEILEINGFDNQTARSFLSEKITGTASSENIKNYLIQLSQGSPFYLEMFSRRFSETMKRKNGEKGEKECLLDALADLLYDSNGVLNHYFNNNVNFFLEKKSRRKYLPILIAMAHGGSTAKAIQENIGRKSKDLGEKLQRLQHMDLIYRSGVFYKISDKLFEYWLKNVYALKTKSVVDDLDIKYLEFKNLAEKDYRDYCEFSALSVTEVILDLFKSFRNEKIHIRLHERKLPMFDSVEICPVTGTITGVKGRLKDRCWMCHIKHGHRANEQDIYDLSGLKTAGAKKSKVARKVFMPLKGIEHNAFLLAKEKNVWVWDVQQLNEILRLFGKFELVL